MIRVVTDSYKRLEVHRSRIKRGRENVLMLEARLDSSLRSHRHQGTFVREFLKAYDIEVLYERVHTKQDFAKFLEKAKRDPNIVCVHFVGHGGSHTRPKIWLTFESIDLERDVQMFSGLDGKILLFSCCDIAAETSTLRKLLEHSKARAIISYRHEIDDAYAYLAEGILYSRLFDTRWRPGKIIRKVRGALKHLEVTYDGERGHTKAALVCFE